MSREQQSGWNQSGWKQCLNLRVGELVEVRAEREILATLDEGGRLENTPFMPEMLPYCGQRFRVFRRSDKTCDNIGPWSIRRMKDTVHLEGLRCDGSGHGGCEAACMIFWKEAWLKRVGSQVTGAPEFQDKPSDDWVAPAALAAGSRRQGAAGDEGLFKIIQAAGGKNPEGETVYSCQATELLKFTSPLAVWDPRQYVRDVRSGNVSTGLACHTAGGRLLELALGVVEVARSLIIAAFNRAQAVRDGVQYPWIPGGQAERTRVEELDLQPGELVEVRGREEIAATLDKRNRNRGLSFDSEMLRYCGGVYRVFRRVRHIVDEKTGKMLHMKYPCIILEGVWCRSDYHRFCPRAIFHYWRESWLQRAVQADHPAASPGNEMQEPCWKEVSR